MMRIMLVLAIAGVLSVSGCGRKNDPLKPVASVVPLGQIAHGQA